MNDVVNLNRVRKRNARDAKAITAAENRARFGQTKADYEATQQRESKAQRQHEHNYLEQISEKHVLRFDERDHASLKNPNEDEA